MIDGRGADTAGRLGHDMDHVEVGGLQIAFERAGSGSLLVLLHGILFDSRAWRRQLNALSDAFTVVAWDTPGLRPVVGSSGDVPPPRLC